MPLPKEIGSNEMSGGLRVEGFVLFPWNSSFETGLEVIDEQHQALVDLLNRLGQTLISSSSDEVSSAFEELARYADQHFRDEELVWAEYLDGDSWFASHQLSHAAFLPRVLEIRARGEGKTRRQVVESLVMFLIRWLAFHILDDDKRLALCVASLQEGKSLEEAKAHSEKQMSGSMRILIEAILQMYDELASNTIALMRETAARMRAEAQLKKAAEEIKVLRGVLPICSHCKKIRNAEGTWDQLEKYIDSNSEAKFSHSVCPSCVDEHYPD